MIKKVGEINGFMFVTGIAMFVAPQLFTASLIFESEQLVQIESAGLEAWSAVLYLGLIMTAVGYGFWYHLLGRYPVNTVMPF